MATNQWRAPSIALWRRQTALPKRLGERLEALFDAERDQLPLWLPVGLGLGIAAWFALPDAGAWTAFLLGAGALLLAALAAGWGTRWGHASAIFCVAAALGCGLVWWKAERVAAPRLERPQMAEFSAAVESFQRLPAKQSVRLVLRPVEAPHLPPNSGSMSTRRRAAPWRREPRSASGLADAASADGGSGRL
jgi:competence protein ComEC